MTYVPWQTQLLFRNGGYWYGNRTTWNHFLINGFIYFYLIKQLDRRTKHVLYISNKCLMKMPHNWRPLAQERNSIFKRKQEQPMIPEYQENITTQWCSTRGHFTDATQALNISCSMLNSTEIRGRTSPQWGSSFSVGHNCGRYSIGFLCWTCIGHIFYKNEFEK